MFATLAGGLPVPVDQGPELSEGPRAVAGSEVLRRVVDDQRSLGLEPICDGLLDWPSGSLVGTAVALGGRAVALGGPADGVVDPGRRRGTVPRLRFEGPPASDGSLFVARWRRTAELAAPKAAKLVLGGPWSVAGLAAEGPTERSRLAHALAEALNEVLRALEAAGCPLVQVDEPALTAIEAGTVAGRDFVAVQERLLFGLTRLHPSLAVVGGSADGAGPTTVFEPPYRSYLFDLIEGPDNWRLVTAAPGDRGILCGAVPAGPSLGPVGVEVLVYAAHYAAAANGRGLVRVGLASAGSFAGLDYETALARMRLLAAGAAAAEEVASGGEAAVRRWLDVRGWDMRAGGRPVPVRRAGPASEAAGGRTRGFGGSPGRGEPARPTRPTASEATVGPEGVAAAGTSTAAEEPVAGEPPAEEPAAEGRAGAEQ